MTLELDTLKLPPDVALRLAAFLESPLFSVRSSVAKSDYWKHHSSELRTRVSGGKVEVGGVSGYYVPPRSAALVGIAKRAGRAIKSPKKIIDWARSKVALPQLLSYDAAFDAVMSHADISLPVLSKHMVDHRTLAEIPKVLTSASAVRRHYESWARRQASPNIIGHYYYQNILRKFLPPGEIHTVLEIGAGNGNFPSIFFHDWKPVRVILVDLPETLAVAIPFLTDLFPDATIAMPHEIAKSGLPDRFDFAFLTVDQLDAIGDSSVDLAINCHSFQEMTQPQIAQYLQLVQRACREGKYFFTANRVEKIPSGEDAFTEFQADPPNRFAEFPWNPRNDVLVHEISRFSRLVQLDSIAMRLERVHK